MVLKPKPVAPAERFAVGALKNAFAKSKCNQPAPSLGTKRDKKPAALLAPPAPPPFTARLFAVSAYGDGHFP